MSDSLSLFYGPISGYFCQLFLLCESDQALLALGKDLLILLKTLKRRQLLCVSFLELLFHEFRFFLGPKRCILLVREHSLKIPVLLINCKHLFLKLLIFLHETAHSLLRTHILLLDNFKMALIFKQKLL
jgi:hypothetical protein